MSRPKKKTDPYPIRLPIELQEHIERHANNAGITPRQWVEATATRAITSEAQKVTLP